MPPIAPCVRRASRRPLLYPPRCATRRVPSFLLCRAPRCTPRRVPSFPLCRATRCTPRRVPSSPLCSLAPAAPLAAPPAVPCCILPAVPPAAFPRPRCAPSPPPRQLRCSVFPLSCSVHEGSLLPPRCGRKAPARRFASCRFVPRCGLRVRGISYGAALFSLRVRLFRARFGDGVAATLVTA